MGRTKEAPRYNVISMRIDDVDAEMIDTITSRTGQTRSDIMREALEMWKSTFNLQPLGPSGSSTGV